jgi:hypothetical protein
MITLYIAWRCDLLERRGSKAARLNDSNTLTNFVPIRPELRARTFSFSMLYLASRAP